MGVIAIMIAFQCLVTGAQEPGAAGVKPRIHLLGISYILAGDTANVCLT